MKTLSHPWHRPRTLSLALALFSVFCGGSRAQVAAPAPVRSAHDAIDLSANRDAQADRLYAQIWMETSPEYRALCMQAFNAALLNIQARVRLAPETDERPVGATGKPLAVVADLDETILDNSGYQRQLVLAGKEYNSDSWKQWVSQVEGVRLTPGAKRFVEAVESLGVTMVYLSNRRDELRQSTVDTMARLGLQVEGFSDPGNTRLLLRRETSDKEPRRRQALEEYEVIAFLGDNIEDFPALLGESQEDRLKRADHFQELWGTVWFVFPNPAYGSWTEPFQDGSPREYLKNWPEPSSW